jgi:uncharacterized protein (DUF433 family)
MSTPPRIVANPAVMAGKPVVAGTRLTVELILEELADGMSVDEIIGAHPRLVEQDVRAALRYAADYMRHEDVDLAPFQAA